MGFSPPHECCVRQDSHPQETKTKRPPVGKFDSPRHRHDTVVLQPVSFEGQLSTNKMKHVFTKKNKPMR